MERKDILSKERVQMDKKEREWMDQSTWKDIICVECKKPFSKTCRELPDPMKCTNCYWKIKKEN